MTTDKNPPAFPAQMLSVDGDTTVTDCYSGMSLRDWFAGQALDEMIYGPNTCDAGAGEAERIAKMCYVIADAMLEARSK